MTHPENLTRDEARRRASLLGDLAYEVSLDLTDDDETFRSETTVTFSCSEPGEEVHVDLTAADVERVELNGNEVKPDAVSPTRILLTGLEDDNRLEVVARCSYRRDGSGMHRSVDPVDDAVYLHSQFEPFDAHLVFACFDQPDLKGTFEFTVQAPVGWQVVSNSPVVGGPEDGLWRFERTPLLSPYVTAVVAGPYHVQRNDEHDVPMRLFCRRSLAEHLDAEELFDLTAKGLDLFQNAFDFPYPFAKYDQLFVPEFASGAMENPGCVTFNESYLFRSRVTKAARESRAATILHEMAHMWFGDLVTMRWWDDLWLNESFATLLSFVALTEGTEYTDGWVRFTDGIKSWARTQDQLPTTHPITADVPDVESVHQNFDGITYAKGAAVLRQLMAWVGGGSFIDGCRLYFERHAWGNTTVEDFLAALEEASGRDLDGWADSWLRTAGVNTLSLEVEQDGEGSISDATLVQSADGDGPLRPHRVSLGLYDLKGRDLARTEIVDIETTGDRTPVPELVGRARPDVFLLNDGDLAHTVVHIDPASLDTLTKQLHRLQDPLARTVAWGSAWSMVRDAKLSATDFAEAVRANIDGETHVGVLQSVLQRVRSAVDSYGDPDRRDAAMARVAGHAYGALLAAHAGSDHQLAWVRHWASASRTDEDLPEVRSMLEGWWQVVGVEVDTELRWHLLTCLAAAGAVEDERIDAEVEADPTDLGRRRAQTARAARPVPAVKQSCWEQLIAGDLARSEARAVMRGFRQMHQADILEKYVDPYFEALPRMFETRPLDTALDLARGLFPHPCAGPHVLERATDLLDSDSLRGPLRRLLLEERDAASRIVRAREVDAGSA